MKSNTVLFVTVAATVGAVIFGCHGSTLASPGENRQESSSAQPQQSQDTILTRYNLDVGSPQVAVSRDGTINVAYVEATKPGIENFVFYRSSSNGGKSWSESKNLSEDIAGRTVGPVRLTVDGAGRVYAIWRVSGVPYVGLNANTHQSGVGCNLVYRVLTGSQWSAIQPVNLPVADSAHQHIGAGSFFAGADPAGKVHVAYILNTDVFHPEFMLGAGTSFPQHFYGMGQGSLAQVDLDGTQHSTPREAFLTPVTRAPNNNKCDALDLLDGYFDSTGSPVFIAQASSGVGEISGSRIVICEKGKQSTVVTLPGGNNEQFTTPPYLLADAQGRNHVIVDFKGGEHHTIRDYVAGSDQYTHGS